MSVELEAKIVIKSKLGKADRDRVVERIAEIPSFSGLNCHVVAIDSAAEDFDVLISGSYGMGQVQAACGELLEYMTADNNISGMYEARFDGEVMYEGSFGEFGNAIRLISLDNQIKALLKLRYDLRSQPVTQVAGLQESKNIQADSLAEFVAIRSADNYDPNVSALLGLSTEAKKSLEKMSDDALRFLKGEINSDTLSALNNYTIAKWNDNVDLTVNISQARNRSRRIG